MVGREHDRSRHHGSAGGWENQIPSEDPREEVVMLHAAFELVKQCQCLVHSKSNLADYLYAIMTLHNPRVQRIDIDRNKQNNKIHRARNAETVWISTQYE